MNMQPTNATQPTAAAGASDANQLQTAQTVAQLVYDGPEAIERRLSELDHEWTAGQLIKIFTSLGIFVGLGLAVFVHVAWLALPIVLGLLLLDYALNRHSLLASLLRWAGFRTRTEVEHERIALKALRGDFRHLPTVLDRHDEDALARMAGEGGIAEEIVEETSVVRQDVVHQVLDTLRH